MKINQVKANQVFWFSKNNSYILAEHESHNIPTLIDIARRLFVWQSVKYLIISKALQKCIYKFIKL